MEATGSEPREERLHEEQAEHVTLGLGARCGNPTSSVDPLEGLILEIEAMVAARAAALEAIPLSSLSGVRLGKRERWLLLHLPTARIADGGSRFRGFPKKLTDSESEVYRRALAKLQRIGLIDFHADYYVAPLGRKVLGCYRNELETGRRIRWSDAVAE